MELRHFRYVVAVAEERHLTRAAERLGIQQPPLSQQIRALEAELGVQLFRRLPRGMEPTQAGAALAEEGRAILARAEHAAAAAKRTARGEAGKLGLGFTSSASFHPLVPRAIRAFRDAHPLVSLSLDESGTTELAAALRAEQIDAAFIRSPIAPQDDLAVHALLDEDMFAALPTGHKLAGTTPLALTALADETLILYRRPLGPGLHDSIIAACQRAGFSPQIGQEAPRMLSTLSLVASGLGVSLVPASMRRLQAEGIAYRPLSPDAGLAAPLNLAHRRGDTAPALRRFVTLARGLADTVDG
ncbi:MAG TPA: LysR family transcriptional regulator [Stellaceae bacterium]|jgi:DNA-binding transcriptional LysR family regulator